MTLDQASAFRPGSRVVYFEVDLDRVWDTVKEDLPQLVRNLEEIIKTEETDKP